MIGTLLEDCSSQIQYSLDGKTYYSAMNTQTDITGPDLNTYNYKKKIQVPQGKIPTEIKTIYFTVSNDCDRNLITISIEDINIVYKTSTPPPKMSEDEIDGSDGSDERPKWEPQQHVSTCYNKTHIIIITVCSVFFIGIISLIIYLTTKSKTKFN